MLTEQSDLILVLAGSVLLSLNTLFVSSSDHPFILGHQEVRFLRFPDFIFLPLAILVGPGRYIIRFGLVCMFKNKKKTSSSLYKKSFTWTLNSRCCVCPFWPRLVSNFDMFPQSVFNLNFSLTPMDYNTENMSHYGPGF